MPLRDLRIIVFVSVVVTMLLQLPSMGEQASSEIERLKEENVRLKAQLAIANARVEKLTSLANEKAPRTDVDQEAAVLEQLEVLRSRYTEGYPLVVQKKAEL